MALDRAVDLFARQGYVGTSIAQLTQAMELTPPQLYAAYGNKRHLFDLVIERYGEHRRAHMEVVLAQPTRARRPGVGSRAPRSTTRATTAPAAA